MSWTGNGSSSSSSRLSDWLDPNGSGVASLDGFDPNGGVDVPAFCLTSVKEIDDNISFEMYPNPASNSLTVMLFNNGLNEVCVELVDLQGRLMSSHKNISGASMKVDLSCVSSGVYFIRVIAEGTIQTEKLIVE